MTGLGLKTSSGIWISHLGPDHQRVEVTSSSCSCLLDHHKLTSSFSKKQTNKQIHKIQSQFANEGTMGCPFKQGLFLRHVLLSCSLFFDQLMAKNCCLEVPRVVGCPEGKNRAGKFETKFFEPLKFEFCYRSTDYSTISWGIVKLI